MKLRIAKLNNGLVFPMILILLISYGCERRKTVTTGNQEGLSMLMEGNERFAENKPLHPNQSKEMLKNLKEGQSPFAVVITCSDSRVPPELIFDQGLGGLFVIRNAGNIIGDYELGSVEYAVEHLGTPLVIVLGHTECGAVGAYIEHKHDSISNNHIQKIVDYIKAEPEERVLNESSANYYNESIEANVMHGMRTLRDSEPVIAKLVKANKVQLIGAVYDIETGKIRVLKE